MHVRATTTKRGNKTYQYAQLVESYRRETDVARRGHRRRHWPEI
jgi:hypothetical protein